VPEKTLFLKKKGKPWKQDPWEKLPRENAEKTARSGTGSVMSRPEAERKKEKGKVLRAERDVGKTKRPDKPRVLSSST